MGGGQFNSFKEPVSYLSRARPSMKKTAWRSITVWCELRLVYIVSTKVDTKVCFSRNKPAAQAAGADPFRFNSTNRQNQPIQQNRRNSFMTESTISNR